MKGKQIKEANLESNDVDLAKQFDNNVFQDYKDKFFDENALEIDISAVDIFSLARHGRIN